MSLFNNHRKVQLMGKTVLVLTGNKESAITDENKAFLRR
jgi:hypothetical protein